MSEQGPGLLSRPWVRIACAVLGTGVLVLAVWAAGARAVLASLGASVHALPALALLEAVMVGCSTLALRALYGDVGPRVAARTWVRAGALGYALGLVLPMGRGAGEAARAVLLSRSTGGARAAVAAVQMQGVVLLSTAVISVPVLAATLGVLGPGLAAGLVLANAVIAGALGTSILVARERAKLGRLLGGLIKRLERFGLAFDAVAGASRADLARSLAWESAGRVAQVAQCGVALAAIGQPGGLLRTLVVRGALILGSAVGDFIPGQLGATEATLVLGAETLALTAAGAATLALLIHAAQILLGLLCAGLTVALPGQQGTSAGRVEVVP
ncbi:MAG TPA: lysylphosphatidylglycerol synthase domain-containing protein [Myxococcaceae bacterium]